MDNEQTDSTPRPDTTTPEDVESEPRGNPDTDQEALDKGVDQLERVKPY
jgi:hypothetical protein